MQLKCRLGQQIFLPPPFRQGVGDGEMGGGGGEGRGPILRCDLATITRMFIPVVCLL